MYLCLTCIEFKQYVKILFLQGYRILNLIIYFDVAFELNLYAYEMNLFEIYYNLISLTLLQQDAYTFPSHFHYKRICITRFIRIMGISFPKYPRYVSFVSVFSTYREYEIIYGSLSIFQTVSIFMRDSHKLFTQKSTV